MRSLQLPELYPGWKTVRKIGTGSFGTVYEIERDLFGRIERSALKHISIPLNDSEVEEMYSNGYDTAGITTHYERCLELFVREYSLMAELKGHTNVVYCDDIRYAPNEDGIGWDIYIKMELLTSLVKSLESEINEEQVIRLGKDLCHALALCRKRNIVHRDIKPQNIFVTGSGDYKLGDFGIAKTAEGTAGGTKIGTYSYMAPEVYHDQPYGTAADIYSLGLVMYWMLNERRLPFLPLPPTVPTYDENEDARHRRLSGEPLPPPAHGSEELKKTVLKACAYDPKDRFASAWEMLDALNGLFRSVIPASQEKKTIPSDVLTEEIVQMEEEDATVGLFFRDNGKEQQILRAAQHKEAEHCNREQVEMESYTREQGKRERIRREQEYQENQRVIKAKRGAEDEAETKEDPDIRTKISWYKAEESTCQLLSNQDANQNKPDVPSEPSNGRRPLKMFAVISLIWAIIAAGCWYISIKKLDPALTRQGDYVYYYQSGIKQLGWERISGKSYYFDRNGIMQTGWQKISRDWYYFADNGIMQTGWKKLGGVQYFFDSNGAMRTGWLALTTGKYYFDGEGAMQTGWQKIGRDWYYFTKNGTMQTGWRKLGGVQYYFGDNGVMRTGRQAIDGKWYTFDKDGALVEPR